MSEVEYSVDNGIIRFRIPTEMRGIGIRIRGQTNERIGLNPCSEEHFTQDPTSVPDRPSVNLTGRWEYLWDNVRPGGETVSNEATAQINQAGNYIYGCFQVDATYLRTIEGMEVSKVDHAITGYFYGRINDNCPVTVVFGGSDRQRERQYSVRIRVISEREIELPNIGFTYSFGADSTRIAALHFTKMPLAGADLPRLPDEILAPLERRNPLLYQSEARLFRSNQIRAMKGVLRHIAEKIRNCAAQGSNTEKSRSLGDILRFIREIVSERRIPTLRSSCQCRSGSVARCSCGIPFRNDQEQLLKHLLLNGLEKHKLFIDGDNRSLLELIYNIAESLRTDSGEFHDFTQFRRLLGLQEHLAHYEYRCSMLYLEETVKVPEFPVEVGCRGIRLTMTRYRKAGSEWRLDGDRNTSSSTFSGIMALFKLGGGPSEGYELPAEGGVVTFIFHTNRLWTWGNFPGILWIFSASLEIMVPFFDNPGLEGTVITFNGTGSLPPLIVEMENCEGFDTDLKRGLSAGLVVMLGYLFHPGADVVDNPHIPSLTPWVSQTIQAIGNQPVCFEFDLEVLTEPSSQNHLDGGRAELGLFLAKYLVLFLNPSNHVRIEGHASRKGSYFHNQVLSVRRSQFTTQAVVDIFGSYLAVPLTRQSQNNGGTFRLFGFGEQQAEGLGVTDGVDNPDHRRVDVSVNGKVVLRLRAGGDSDSNTQTD